MARILVIEDAEDVRQLMVDLLEAMNHSVVEVADGLSGVKAALTEHPDLIMLDLMMPDMDGWEVFRAMKANPDIENIPVIILTARAQSIDKVLGLHIAKVQDYLTKPFGQNELITSIEKVLNAAKQNKN